MRLVIPDMEKSFKAYVNKDYKYFELINIDKKIPQSKKYASTIDYINYGTYSAGAHKYSYDFEKKSKRINWEAILYNLIQLII